MSKKKTEIEAYSPGAVQAVSGVKAVTDQIDFLNDLFKDVLKSKVDYGIIPGCGKKPVLYLNGAEKIERALNLRCEFTIQLTSISQDGIPPGHREYFCECKVFPMSGGNMISNAFAMCSTLEKKYRYFKGDNGVRYEVKDIADKYETVLLIAQKRAKVKAIRSLGMCSFMFDQDLEDFEPDEKQKKEYSGPPEKRERKMASDEQRAKFSEKFPDTETLEAWVRKVTEAKFGEPKNYSEMTSEAQMKFLFAAYRVDERKGEV